MEFQSWKVNFKNWSMFKDSKSSSRNALDQRSWDSSVNWRFCDIAIACGAKRFPRLRYAWCDDCVCIEKTSQQSRSLPQKSKCRRAACSKKRPILTRETKLFTWCASISVQREFMKRYKDSQICSVYVCRMTTSNLYNFHIDQMMRTRNFRVQNDVVERGSVTTSQKGKKAIAERKVGNCFRWKAHGHCSKGDSCSFRQNRQAQGDLYGGQRRKGRSSSHAPNSKAKTDEGWEKSSHKGREESSSDKRSEILCCYKNCKTRHVDFGILPCVRTTSLNPEAPVAMKADFDMLRQRRSPAKSQRKVVSLHY